MLPSWQLKSNETKQTRETNISSKTSKKTPEQQLTSIPLKFSETLGFLKISGEIEVNSCFGVLIANFNTVIHH